NLGTLVALATVCFAPYLGFAFIVGPALPDRVKWRLNVHLKIESIEVLEESLKPHVRIALRAPRLVLVTLIELFESTKSKRACRWWQFRPMRKRKRDD